MNRHRKTTSENKTKETREKKQSIYRKGEGGDWYKKKQRGEIEFRWEKITSYTRRESVRARASAWVYHAARVGMKRKSRANIISPRL